jgi:hypothetical protein
VVKPPTPAVTQASNAHTQSTQIMNRTLAFLAVAIAAVAAAAVSLAFAGDIMIDPIEFLSTSAPVLASLPANENQS